MIYLHKLKEFDIEDSFYAYSHTVIFSFILVPVLYLQYQCYVWPPALYDITEFHTVPAASKRQWIFVCEADL